MLLLRTLLLSAAAGVAVAAGGIQGLDDIDNLIVFGDSYSDQGRLLWFMEHQEAPPPGTFIHPDMRTASGGMSWPYFASQALNATAFNYAVGGATCTNKLVERQFPPINAPFPSVAEYEVPAFRDDTTWKNESTGKNTLYEDDDGKPTLRAENTVYAFWIGANDLGRDGFFGDAQQNPNTTVARDFADCVWGVFDALYDTGGRHFVLFNLLPLERSPLYASPSHGGATLTDYWTTKTESNTTATEQRMRETVSASNVVFEYGMPFHLLVQHRWPGATFSLFDVNRLLVDLMNAGDHNKDDGADDKKNIGYEEPVADPSEWYWKCAGDGKGNCKADGRPMASFMWYDEMHPSERTDEIIADEFAKLVKGGSDYATYYKSDDEAN